MGGIRRSLRHRRDSGAALVEMALVLPLLLMLLLGLTTAGMAYHQYNSLQTAAREGARFAATLPNVDGDLQTVLDVTKSAAVGNLASSVPGQYVCVAFVDANGSATRLIESNGGPTPPASGCFTDGRTDEERVQVVVGREATINALLFTTTIDLETPAAARYER